RARPRRRARHAPLVAAADAVQVAAPLLWPVLAGAGGLTLLAGGAAAALWGGRWPGMSERYERKGRETSVRTGAAGGERAMWDAIDLGADPTVDHADHADPGRDGC
ncbi:Trp biosynthesis-associated membrane protein, partial [Streptosporangium saharense]|uniref:Trp biosynthesis-associated membrane protein n=1 Tax=Streptosporangium saharense TaxID=1706840 RepID=UPI003326DC9A